MLTYRTEYNKYFFYTRKSFVRPMLTDRFSVQSKCTNEQHEMSNIAFCDQAKSLPCKLRDRRSFIKHTIETISIWLRNRFCLRRNYARFLMCCFCCCSSLLWLMSAIYSWYGWVDWIFAISYYLITDGHRRLFSFMIFKSNWIWWAKCEWRPFNNWRKALREFINSLWIKLWFMRP